ncbi:hypothetical protein SPAN111604_03735 [Sphingomonas antarctica]
MRHWDLRPTSPTTLVGSLSPDAVGPVSGTMSNDVLRIAYIMKGGLSVAQTLKLLPNGVLANHMSIKKLGMTVATVDERITKE